MILGMALNNIIVVQGVHLYVTCVWFNAIKILLRDLTVTPTLMVRGNPTL